MARLKEPKISGTIGNVTVYRMRGILFQRAKSSLTADRVKTDPAFQPTMAYAAILAMAAPISSKVYETLKSKKKKTFSFQYLTGKTMDLLKNGFTENEAFVMMMELYGNLRSFIKSGWIQTVELVNSPDIQKGMTPVPVYTSSSSEVKTSTGSP